MSTLVNIILALVANILTIVGVPPEAPLSSGVEIMQCDTSDTALNHHLIIKNEQLSQKIN